MKTSKTEETTDIAKELAQEVSKGGLICLFGDLGSGKTTFTKGLAEGLGIDKYSVKSPTYTYIRQLNNFYHIDLYRLEEIDELLWNEIEEILNVPTNIVVIEWADRMQEKLPSKRIDVQFKYVDENTREVTIDRL